MHGIRKGVLASALALGLGLAGGPAAAQFSGFVLFGDSLNDVGSFKPVLPPGTGLFTTNPGPIWVTPFGQHYGFNISPANQGGTDYAEGGARVTQLPGVPNAPPTGTATPVSTQVQNFLAKGPVNSGALYALWAGGNDLFVQLQAVLAGTQTPAQAQANVALAAGQLAQQVGILSAAGAKYIMVFNLPDAGKSPFGVASGQGATISALTSFYNDTLNAGLNSLKIDIIRLNIFGLVNEVIASPATYGLINVSTPACGATPSLVCTSANLVAPNAAQTFLFADGVHPTTAGNQIISDYALSVVSAPQQMGLLANAPVQVEQANFRALDDRMFSALNSPRPTSKYEAYAVYDYGNNDLSSDVGGGHMRANTIVIGGDSKITQQLLAGVAFGYTEDKASLGNSGGFTLDDATITFYLGYGSGPWYLGATVGGGSLDYRDIRRSFPLGPATRTENSSTNGLQFIARALGGYWFNTAGQWLHGPYGRITYQNIKVDSFAESGTSSTAMSFGSQTFDPFSSSLGWQVAGSIGSIRPFGRASWEYNNNGSRTITASLVTEPGQFSLPAYTFDKNYALFTLGASADLGSKLVGFISLSATAGNSSGNYQAVTVGIRTPL